jgi:hypothetical protein
MHRKHEQEIYRCQQRIVASKASQCMAESRFSGKLLPSKYRRGAPSLVHQQLAGYLQHIPTSYRWIRSAITANHSLRTEKARCLFRRRAWQRERWTAMRIRPFSFPATAEASRLRVKFWPLRCCDPTKSSTKLVKLSRPSKICNYQKKGPQLASRLFLCFTQMSSHIMHSTLFSES